MSASEQAQLTDPGQRSLWRRVQAKGHPSTIASCATTDARTQAYAAGTGPSFCPPSAATFAAERCGLFDRREQCSGRPGQ
jgi:hypothetical protein